MSRSWRAVPDLRHHVHVPFCEVRCSFCEYTVTKADGHAEAREHVDDLLAEMDH